MLGIKKQFIKSMIKLEIVSNTPGKLQVYIAQIKKVEEDYKIYESYADMALRILPGVNRLEVDYDKGIATIFYDENKLTAQKLYKWFQILIDIGIDYYDEIKAAWEKDQTTQEAIKVQQVWQKMKPILEKALVKVN